MAARAEPAAVLRGNTPRSFYVQVLALPLPPGDGGYFGARVQPSGASDSSVANRTQHKHARRREGLLPAEHLDWSPAPRMCGLNVHGDRCNHVSLDCCEQLLLAASKRLSKCRAAVCEPVCVLECPGVVRLLIKGSACSPGLCCVPRIAASPGGLPGDPECNECLWNPLPGGDERYRGASSGARSQAAAGSPGLLY